MSQFATSFCIAALHSLWQAGLLWIIYTAANKTLMRRNHPLEKRNFLFITLLAQLTLFIVTFFIYYSSPATGTQRIGSLTSNLLPAKDLQAYAPGLFGAYVLVLATRITLALSSWNRFRNQYLPGMQKPGIDLKLFTQLKAFQFGIKRKVTLWLSSTIQTPVTFGFFRPVIVLPLALVNHISPEQAETLILHELTHIRTNDYLLNWFLVIMENIFFFNPFIRSFGKSIRLEREKNCDLGVLAFSYSPALYAETLLAAERMRQLVPGFSLAAVQHKKQLLHRIRFFISGTESLQPRRRRLLLPLIISACMMLLIAGSLNSPATQTPAPTENDMAALVAMPAGSGDYWESPEIQPVLADEGERYLQNLNAEMQKQRPAIERQVRKMQPLIRSIQEKIEKISDRYRELELVPVALKESEPESREVIIREESSGSKATAVKVYRMVLLNGQWTIVPEWMATSKEVPVDTSANIKKDSVKSRPLLEQ